MCSVLTLIHKLSDFAVIDFAANIPYEFSQVLTFSELTLRTFLRILLVITSVNIALCCLINQIATLWYIWFTGCARYWCVKKSPTEFVLGIPFWHAPWFVYSTFFLDCTLA